MWGFFVQRWLGLILPSHTEAKTDKPPCCSNRDIWHFGIKPFKNQDSFLSNFKHSTDTNIWKY